MSVPPTEIKVKRKRNDDGPVTFLRVQGGVKRQQSGVWLYQRRQPDVESADSLALPSSPPPPEAPLASGPLKPVIHESQPGDENRPIKALQPHAPPGTDPADSQSDEVSIQQSLVAQPVGPPPLAAHDGNRVKMEPRRFHLSRLDIDTPADAFRGQGVSKKSRYASAVFVERSVGKRKRLEHVTSALDHIGSEASAVGTGAGDAVSFAAQNPRSQPLKRPVRASRPAGQQGNSTKPDHPPEKQMARPQPRVPVPLADVNDTEMEQLARDMDAYTLYQIGQDLQKLEQLKARDSAPPARSRLPASTTARLKPKVPARRHAERHPETAAAQDAKLSTGEGHQADVEHSESEDGDDYIEETYYRVPATALGASVPVEQVGLLVFDNDPDIEFFYGNSDDSDDEWLEDDEDENAENYYAADYPEEEVDSDDEYGRNVYGFRNGNASDLEEFDEADFDGSDGGEPLDKGGRFVDDSEGRFRISTMTRDGHQHQG